MEVPKSTRVLDKEREIGQGHGHAHVHERQSGEAPAAPLPKDPFYLNNAA